MSNRVQLTRQGDIAILRLDSVPLDGAMCQAIHTAMIVVINDPEVAGIILLGGVNGFPVGGDLIHEGTVGLDEICDQIEACPKPVIAALHRRVMGGGAALALAAHARVAQAPTRIGFPEVNIGQMPPGGACLRLPRIIGAHPALEVLLSARPHGAHSLGAPLFDAIGPRPAFEQAMDMLRSMIADPARLKRSCDRNEGLVDAMKFQSELAERRADPKGPAHIEREVLTCVEAAALVPFAVAQEMERAARARCRDHPVSRALVHSFHAERHARVQSKTPVASIGLYGASPLAAGLAVAAVENGIGVMVADASESRMAAFQAQVARIHERMREKHDLSQEEIDRRLSQILFLTDVHALSEVGLVFETLPVGAGDLEGHYDLLGKIQGEDAVLVAAQRLVDVEELSACANFPENVLAIHFAAPVHVKRAAELRIGSHSSRAAKERVLAFLARVQKFVVQLGYGADPVAPRLEAAYYYGADSALMAGSTPYAVDIAMRKMGFALGPYQQQDISGIDTMLARRAPAYDARGWPQNGLGFAVALQELGWVGQKGKRGYYRYDEDGMRGHQDTDVLRVLGEVRARDAVTMKADALSERCLLAVVNECAHLLQDHAVARPYNLDILAIHALGFPRTMGGPTQWADEMGLMTVLGKLRLLAKEDAGYTPAPLLEKMVKSGQTFRQLDHS